MSDALSQKRVTKKTNQNLMLSLDYYTLKQAANELNYICGHEHFDEQYLLQLAADGKIQLVLPAFIDPLIAKPSKLKAQNEAIRQLIKRETHHLFFIIPNAEVNLVSLQGECTLYSLRQFYVYNKWKIYNTSSIRERSIHPDLIDDYYTKNPMAKNEGLFLKDSDISLAGVTVFYFGTKNTSYVVDYKKDPQFGELIEERTKNIIITKDNLVLLAPELTRIIANDLRKLGKAEYEDQQSIEQTMKSNGKIEKTNLMITEALASLAKLPRDKPFKAAEILRNHADTHGIEMPKNIKTIAGRLDFRERE